MIKIILLIGPTAVGKTSVAIELAKILKTEIISSDSMQIYRYMDIGTAKPTVEQRKQVPHHMIDIVDPWEYFSTGEYIEKVKTIIEKLIKEGKNPLIVGGTGLYLKALTEGIFKGPSADWQLRKKLLEEEKSQPGTLYNLLKELDPVAAVKIYPSDFRRIIRALEVFLKEKVRISYLQNQFTKPLPYQFIKIGLTRNRKELYELIERRVDRMLEEGLIEEVRRVLELIRKHAKTDMPLTSLQAIGYKEISGYIADLYSLDEAIRLIKKRTKTYAKRQFTWFKKDKDIKWFDITGMNDPKEIAEKIYLLHLVSQI